MNNLSVYELIGLTIAIIVICILVFSIIFFTWKGKKDKKTFFSLRKLTTMSSFLAIYVIQVAITIPLASVMQVPFSLKGVTVLTVGFIFGPIEGIVFGMIADTIQVFMNGYTWQAVFFIQEPLLGLFAGIAGLIFAKNKEYSILKMAILVQIPILLITLTPIIISNINAEALFRSKISLLFVSVFSPISFIVLEGMLAYFILKKERIQILLFVLIVFVAISARMINSWFLTPLGNVIIGYPRLPYEIQMYSRMITTSYQTPINIVVTYVFIEASLYAKRILNF